jgi:hypothetical protein
VLRALLIVLLAGLSLPASAQKATSGHLVVVDGGVRIDWTRGVMLSKGARAGDTRAPNPALARVAARRLAQESARELLDAAARKLAIADKGTVGDSADGHGAVAARLTAAVGRSVVVGEDYGSDGSMVLDVALPLEAVRVAVSGAAAPPAASDRAAVSAIIVDARKLVIEPQLGLRLTIGSESYAGPTVFHTSLARARKDQRLGAAATTVMATSAKGASITLASGKAFDAERLAKARSAGALVVVVVKKSGK